MWITECSCRGWWSTSCGVDTVLMNQRCIPTYRITVLSLCRPHTTHGTHSLTLKCSLKLEQRCVIRCVRPTSTTCRRRAGRHRQTLLSLSWLLSAVLQSEDLYDLLLLWWSPYYSPPPPTTPPPPLHWLLPKHTWGREWLCALRQGCSSQAWSGNVDLMETTGKQCSMICFIIKLLKQLQPWIQRSGKRCVKHH